jgi:hypothetical protein
MDVWHCESLKQTLAMLARQEEFNIDYLLLP